MDTMKLQTSLKDACELWRLAGNSIVSLEMMPDVAYLDLATTQMRQLCDCIDAARHELVHGEREGKRFPEEFELLVQLTLYTNGLAMRLQSAAQAMGVIRGLVLLGKMASC